LRKLLVEIANLIDPTGMRGAVDRLVSRARLERGGTDQVDREKQPRPIFGANGQITVSGSAPSPEPPER
jgi:hypothetical protein